jgi:AcrR family transcriptional regulator
VSATRTAPTSTASSRPGRHRSQAADTAILEAALEVLADEGYAGLTMAAVIERAGVSSATLYRRWPTKQQLVVAAVETLVPAPSDTDTGSLAGDLDAFARDVAASIAVHHEDIAQTLNRERRRNPELAAALRERFRDPRLRELRGMLTRAKERGELGTAPSPEVVLSLVAGPIYHRAFYLGEPITQAFVRTTVDHTVRALSSA